MGTRAILQAIKSLASEGRAIKTRDSRHERSAERRRNVYPIERSVVLFRRQKRGDDINFLLAQASPRFWSGHAAGLAIEKRPSIQDEPARAIVREERRT